MSFDAADHRYMARALKLAELGLYTTDPNPRVGCVLVKDDRIVGEGFHRRAGEPHAERIALADAGEAARGATAYVTLEPCCHHGRTPPCTDALIAAGVAEVVSAMQDPNPKVSGQGNAHLAAAGIATRCGLFEEEAVLSMYQREALSALMSWKWTVRSNSWSLTLTLRSYGKVV